MFLFNKNKELFLVFFITILFLISVFIFILRMLNKPESYEYDTDFSEYKYIYNDLINKINYNVLQNKENVKDYYNLSINNYFNNKSCYIYLLQKKIKVYFKNKDKVIICSSNQFSNFDVFDNFLISNNLEFNKNIILKNDLFINHYELKNTLNKKELIYNNLNSLNSFLLDNEEVYLIERNLKKFNIQLLFINYNFDQCMSNNNVINKEICIWIEQIYELSKIHKAMNTSFNDFVSILILNKLEIYSKKNYIFFQSLKEDFKNSIDYNKFLLQIEKNSFNLNYLNIFNILRNFSFISLSFTFFIVIMIFTFFLMIIKIKKN